jgi:Sulfotransferase domain
MIAAEETPGLCRADVISAYRTFLGREPENETVIGEKLRAFSDPYALAFALAQSVEFRLQRFRAREGFIQPKHLIVIGCHHKTGTQWMGALFQTIAKGTNLKFLNGVQRSLKGDENIFFQVDSLIDLNKLPPYRGIHIIRDPRDIIVSGMFYHEKTKEEDWLMIKDAKFGGLSYQDKLASLNSFRDKCVFEMDNRGGQTIKQISLWNYKNRNMFEVKYEDLIQDYRLDIFSTMFRFLGFGGLSLAYCLESAWYTSLFSGKVRKSGVHVRSGAPKQWEKYFTKGLAQDFLDRFGDVLVRLGYEANDEWARNLPSD